MNPLVINLPDPAAAAPVAAADPAVVVVPAVPAVPAGPDGAAPVSAGPISPRGVNWFDWFLPQQPENILGKALSIFNIYWPARR